jgi:hypothetical protein
MRIFQPETFFKWHRELERLVVRLARENHDWGNGRIEGECQKLGHEISEETVGNILKRHGIPPAPERQPSRSWRHLMTHYKEQILACDFFTVETLFLKTWYVLFFIELGTRRVYLAGCTEHPTEAWVTQQARQMSWQLEDRELPIRFLIHDRDTKFNPSFDTVFRSETITIIRTPYRAPNANAFAERWVRTVREECLDKLFIINEKHLRQVLKIYVSHYNQSRPHQGINQETPISFPGPDRGGSVQSRDILGGIIHEYYRTAA